MSTFVQSNLDNANTRLINVTKVYEQPCPTYFAPFYYNSPMGWNAVLVGLLSSVLAIIFLLTCLYYLLCRRRYYSEISESSTPVALVDKNGALGIPVTSSSQTATTTFINEAGKETKISTYTEQGTGSTGNGHTGTNGLMANGNADPSELRLLSHEHH
ncbi:hypothetical protein I4U23_024612 [Adineta vaga]|nr:hypothetical protein I4U23_024612 [Adineta vaga]